MIPKANQANKSDGDHLHVLLEAPHQTPLHPHFYLLFQGELFTFAPLSRDRQQQHLACKGPRPRLSAHVPQYMRHNGRSPAEEGGRQKLRGSSLYQDIVLKSNSYAEESPLHLLHTPS